MISKLENRIKRYRQKKYINAIMPAEHGNSKISIIGNAIPKSGTYLLNSIFNYFECWIDVKYHLLNNSIFEFHSSKDTKSHSVDPVLYIPTIPNGQIYAAHLNHSERLARCLCENPSIKHIFMYRDPRDIFVSYANFSTYSSAFRHWKRSRNEQDFMLNFFQNDDDRLAYIIPKMTDREDWNTYLTWLSDPNTFCLKFEDLYLDLQNTSQGKLGKTICSLLTHLEINATEIDPYDFGKAVLGNGFTASSELDKIGQYKRVFKEQHFRLIDNPIIEDILFKFGYKKHIP